MIEKMKYVCIAASQTRKDDMISGLRDLGIVHIAEKKSAGRAETENFAELSRLYMDIAEYAPDKKSQTQEAAELLSDEEFSLLRQKVKDALETKSLIIQKINADSAEIDRISGWGDFSPEDLQILREEGYDLHFYKVDKNVLEVLQEDESVRFIRLASVDKMDTVAVFGKLPLNFHASEFSIPEKSVSSYREEISSCLAEIEKCESVLKEAALHSNSFNAQLLKAQNAENYSSAAESTEKEDGIVWLCGYIPEADVEKFRESAAKNRWAWAIDDVADDDDHIPTKLRFGKVSRLIKPVFDILGILPGYRETDISLWFFLFFILFFAMIMGDGGYGLLILAGTLAYTAKAKKFNDATYLLTVLSIGTILWGAVTGTWFGMESAMKIPFLKALVIPGIASYPEYFQETSSQTQNMIMKLSFSIGAIQMSLGSLLAIRKKISEKDLSWLSNLGWLVAVVAMYLLSLYLVIGENIPIIPIFACIGIAFALVVLFGGMSPDRTIGQGLKAGLADSFTVFLNTISCFGNVMSYIRLFAVGMAGLAISQSFNNMAAGFSGPMIIVAAVIVIIGHALNIVMCFLSVVVHGVRLNVLEFSGQVGLEWTGIGYEPFKLNDKIKK